MRGVLTSVRYCIYIYIYIYCMYVCIYIYIYIYVCSYINKCCIFHPIWYSSHCLTFSVSSFISHSSSVLVLTICSHCISSHLCFFGCSSYFVYSYLVASLLFSSGMFVSCQCVCVCVLVKVYFSAVHCIIFSKSPTTAVQTSPWVWSSHFPKTDSLNTRGAFVDLSSACSVLLPASCGRCRTFVVSRLCLCSCWRFEAVTG